MDNLNIMINSWSDNYNIPDISDSSSDAYLVSSNCVFIVWVVLLCFPFSVPCNCLLKGKHDALIKATVAGNQTCGGSIP